MCKNFKEKGLCKYGDKCLFAHGDHELASRQPAKVGTDLNVTKKDETTVDSTKIEVSKDESGQGGKN